MAVDSGGREGLFVRVASGVASAVVASDRAHKAESFLLVQNKISK
jgi:hypothetical protein